MNLSKLRRMALDGDMSSDALRYLLNCRAECEHLDYKETLHFDSDYCCATLGRDIIAMKNTGGGYIVVGVKDKTWESIGLTQPLDQDTKRLRDLVRKATGLDIETDIVKHKLFTSGEYREFALILVRSTAKRNKLRVPSICRISFRPQEAWGIRNGDIYFRKGDQTVRVSSENELEDLLDDLLDRQERSALEQERIEPSPFWVETGLYRLLPREYETFVGRTELLRTAQEAIERDPRIWIVNLYGPGGVGKSAIASWLAYDYYDKGAFDAILQLSAKDTELTTLGISRLRPTLYSLENLLDSILHLFGFSEYIGASLDARSEIATTLLSDYSILMVLDNLEAVQDGRVMEFVQSLPPSTKAKVLLTSRLRSRSWEMPVRVKELDPVEVKDFVRIRIGEMGIEPTENIESFATRIYEASGGLPLAIQWMLGKYAITKDLTSVVDQVRKPDSPLLEFSFRNSWSALSTEAQQALAVLSIFDEAPTLHTWVIALDWPIETLERAVSQLIETTFVSKKAEPRTGKETYRALPITLAFARNELGKMGTLELMTRTRYQRYIQQMGLIAAETGQFASVFDRFGIERETEKRAIILAQKAESRRNALDYYEAEHLYQRALEIDPRSVYVLVNYGLLKLEIGQVGEAIRLIENAAQRCDKKSGFFVYYNLSKVYDAIRDRNMVERCLRKALEYDPKHSVARHQLGVVVSRLGRYGEAIQIFDELIKDELARDLGPSDTLLYAYKTKILNLEKSGKSAEAQTVVKSALIEIKQWPHLANKAYELEELV